MKKIELRPLGIAAILLLCAVFCQAQREQDTLRVVLLLCDTSVRIQGNDYGLFPNPVGWKFGYSVRQLHNTSEGVMDAGGQICIDNKGNIISCWYDFWKHLYYLDDKKQPLKSTVIVWQSVSAK